MLFKNPTLLYGLLFLLIPIIVHLFQLRKFKKVAFTNVAFLKPIAVQTRKSRTIKKWLTLLTRLLAIACLVLAFAQPIIPKESNRTLDEELIIYLDDSYSLQAKGAAGQLYQTAVNELIEKLPPTLNFSLFTNNETFNNVVKKEIANQLISNPYSSNQLDPGQVILKANSLISQEKSSKTLLWISDFQNIDSQPFPALDSLWNTRLVRLQPIEQNNISIDTAFMASTKGNSTVINVALSSRVDIEQPVTVSLFNNDLLVAKTSTDLTNDIGTVQFTWNRTKVINGKIAVEDNSLIFDNQLFISRSEQEKIKVLHINDSPNDFLNRIYTNDEFIYRNIESSKLNYNSIKDQNVIILNELEVILTALEKELKNAVEAGKTLIIIPSLKNNITSKFNPFDATVTAEKKVTQINFDHPLLEGVFSKRIDNFQYPEATQSKTPNIGGNIILSFGDNNPFLLQSENVYFFTAPLASYNSNFKDSPLVVPVFYQLGRLNSNNSSLYYMLGQPNKIAVKKNLTADQIVEIKGDNTQLIPQQRAYNDFVVIKTNNELTNPGTYTVVSDNDPIAQIAFNAPRVENKSNYFDDKGLPGIVYNDVGSFIEELQDNNSLLPMWKLFIAGALLFLTIEMLILKLLK